VNVTTTIKGNRVVARSGNKQATLPVDPTLPEAAAHGTAAVALVSRLVPGYRKTEILNSVKVTKAVPGKTFYTYTD